MQIIGNEKINNALNYSLKKSIEILIYFLKSSLKSGYFRVA